MKLYAADAHPWMPKLESLISGTTLFIPLLTTDVDIYLAFSKAK